MNHGTVADAPPAREGPVIARRLQPLLDVSLPYVGHYGRCHAHDLSDFLVIPVFVGL